MKKIKEFYVTVIFMAVIIVINIVAVGLYISNMNKEIESQTEEHLTELMQEASSCVELKIEETIHELEMIACYIGLEKNSKEQILDIVNDMTAYSGFENFDIIDAKGIGMKNEGSQDYSEVKAYKKALSGDIGIQDVTDSNKKICGIKFYIPIPSSSEVYMAECTLDEFASVLDLDSITSKGKTFLIKPDGTVVSKKSGSGNDDISVVLNNDEQVNKLKSYMKSKKSGVLGFANEDDEKRYVCYSATAYNNWKIVMLVSSSSVDANISDVTDNFVILGVFIGVMLVLLSVYFIYNIIIVRSVNAMNLRRYYLVSQYTDDVIIDYSCVKDTLYSNENWEKYFGYLLPKENAKEVMTKFVFEEDRELFIANLEELNKQKEMVQFQCRITDSQNQPVECRCKFFGIRNRMKRLIKVVGVIEKSL